LQIGERSEEREQEMNSIEKLTVTQLDKKFFAFQVVLIQKCIIL
jgi:hypothetical protein